MAAGKVASARMFVVANELADRPELSAGGSPRVRFDGPVKADDAFADGGDHRAAAAGAAGFRRHRGFTQRVD